MLDKMIDDIIAMLSIKLEKEGLIFPEFQELNKLRKERCERDTAANYWEM